jgi:DNA-binding beta-propeller fold protein YncE
MVPVFLALLLTLAMFGCAGKKQQTQQKVYWPPLEPKMEWITTFSSEDNFPKTEGQVRMETIFGKPERNRFRKPLGLAVDSKGLLYVADMEVGNIWVVDFPEKKMGMYAEQEIGAPVGLVIDNNDFLYVTEALGQNIQVYNPERKLIRTIGAGEFKKPGFMALNEGLGRLYVSGVVGNMVYAYDPATGEKLFGFGGTGSGEGQLYAPQGIAVDEEGRVFVAEQFNTRVQVFDADGNHLYAFGSRGDDQFQFEGPRGLAFDSQGTLFVTEARKAAVLLFTPEGAPLTALGGGRSVHQLGFTLPHAVYIDRNDRVYVSDGMNKRVTIWQMLTPAYLAEHPLDTTTLETLEKKVRMLEEKAK